MIKLADASTARMLLMGVILPAAAVTQAGGQELAAIPKCDHRPLPGHQLSLRTDGIERVRWHHGPQYPRPFFFPLNGPSGAPLTRMGHPGAENHDHHRSVWFAHNDVDGADFWSDNGGTSVRQKHWYAYADGDRETIMAVRLGWFDKNGTELMDQDVIASVRPLYDGEYCLEIQTTLKVPDGRERIVLAQTNFGLLAVRVARTISGHFGGGLISNSEGQTSEKNTFGKPARWMDYSGPVFVGTGPTRKAVIEGITYFDHPSNPSYPSKWHVREDGWMGASLNRDESIEIEPAQPLTLRYLLYVHNGGYDAERAGKVHQMFTGLAGFRIESRVRPHEQYSVSRIRTKAGSAKPDADQSTPKKTAGP